MLFIPKSFLERFKKTPLTAWASLTLGPLVLAGFLLLAIWIVTFARIRQEEKLELDSILVDNGNVARIVAANLDEVLGKTSIYADMATAIAMGKRQDIASFNPAAFGDRAFLRLAVFDEHGRLLFSSVRSSEEPLLSRLISAAAKDPNQSRVLMVGHPEPGSGDAWRVPVLLPLGAQAKLAYLGAHLDLGYFLRLYRDVNLGRSGRIEIIGDDGYQLVESSGMTISAGSDISASDYFAYIRKHQEGAGIMRRPGAAADSVVAFERLERFPFTVAISRNRDDALAEHFVRRARYLWEAVFLTLALLVAAASLTVLARRQRRFFSVARRSEQEKQLLIEQLELERNRAYEQASHDHLTRLPNRLLFSEVAASHLSAARRSRNGYAVFFIDLDRFKQINDTLGHRVGDLLLCEVARRLQSCVRESDLVARFGGDEFVMLIADVIAIDDLALVAAKIVEAVGQPCSNLDGHDLEVRPSLGIAIYGRDGQDIETLLKRADAAMYEAKAAGRGTFRFFDAVLNRTSELHVALAQRLRRAIGNGEFRLHFQARVALDDFRVMGLEALVRWAHPERGMIFPNDFIPMAEEDGLIVPLGHWVIDAACRQLAAWQAAGVPLVPVAINVSPRQLRDEALVGRILAALEKYALPGELLEIEITENCVIDHPEPAMAQLNLLRAQGVRVSMDDYGKGYSNLSLLKSLPIYALKIDRSLICDIHNHSSDAIIVNSAITLAHNLGFRVVAEGVETREQLMHLKTAGCDEVQGYYFHRPAPADEVEPILRQGQFENL
jgi:diguanylate cyclase